MERSNYQWVVCAYLVLAFFSVPHLIDDFLFGVPAEFGLSIHFTQFLAGVFIVIYLGILIPLARGKKSGKIGAMSMGGFLALAGFLKHIPRIIQPGPYWSGWFSEVLIFGVILSGLGVILAGMFAVDK